MFKLIKDIDLYGSGHIKDILIADKMIVEIDDKIDYNLKDLEVIEGHGMIAMPSYIDQHVHVTGGGGEGGFATRVPELKLRDCIKAGVTTIVGLLGTDSATRSVENLVAKTKSLKEYGLTAYCLTGSYEFPSPTLTGSVKKDIIYVDEIIGVKIALADHRSSHISKEKMVKLASQARVGGLLSNKPGLVHIHVGKGIDGLNLLFDIIKTENIPISVFRPTHIGKIVDQAIKFANMGGYIDFTTGKDIDKTANQILKAMNEAPAHMITLSTDSNGSMPIWNDKAEMVGMGVGRMDTLHELIKILINDQGIELKDAIKFSTENVAKALQIYPEKGILAKGSHGDIILLDENLDIDSVFSKGKLMMYNKEILVKGNFE